MGETSKSITAFFYLANIHKTFQVLKSNLDYSNSLDLSIIKDYLNPPLDCILNSSLPGYSVLAHAIEILASSSDIT